MPFSPQTTEIRLNNLKGKKTMTKAQHTPGPWAYHSYTASGRRFSIESLNQYGKPAHGIAAIHPNETASTMLTMEEHEANARLIASAPCLLQALKRWHEFAINNGYTDDDFKTESVGWISETAAAIAKATGE